MTTEATLKPGASIGYGTRAAGMPGTVLFLKGNAEHDSEIHWHRELCNQPDNLVSLTNGEMKTVDISSAGAIVTVRNTGWVDLVVWTDA